jgi:RND superfamily putative drug exporter
MTATAWAREGCGVTEFIVEDVVPIVHRIAMIPAGRRGKWAVLVCWLAAVAVFGILAGKTNGVVDNDQTNWLPHDAESTQAINLARQQFPADSTTPLIVIYERRGGVTDHDRSLVAGDRAALDGLAAAPIPTPAISADHAALLLTMPVSTARMQDNDYVTTLVDHVHSIVDDHRSTGLNVLTTGPVAARSDGTVANRQLDGALAAVTLGIVAVLLLITYRSPLLLLAPLFCIGVGVVVANGAVYLLAAHAGLVVSGTGSFLLTILVFGVGTDYALLLISRYREELRRHADRHDAMAVALRRTVPSVATSAATVILAAMTLLAAAMNSTRGLGAVAAVAVAASLLVMTTLLPALLVVPGRWLLWPRIPRWQPESDLDDTVTGWWRRITAVVGRRPRRAWLVTAALLALATCGVTALSVGGLTATTNYTSAPESVVGQQLVNAHFPGGTTDLTDVYASTGRVDAVISAARRVPGVATVEPVQVSGRWAHVPVVLADSPNSAAAGRTVVRLRAAVHDVDSAGLVGGTAAMNLDTNSASNRDLAVIIPIVLVIVVIMLGLLLRAVVAPLILIGCAVLSAGSALGICALIFRAAGFASTDQAGLLLGFLFLVALGVDYTIFLMGRAREEVAVHGHRAGVLRALGTTGSVITSAGVVLAATFSVFTLTPVVLNVELGLLVAVGVLIDTLVVRSLLVPALALHAGPGIWWPGAPDRLRTTAVAPARTDAEQARR